MKRPIIKFRAYSQGTTAERRLLVHRGNFPRSAFQLRCSLDAISFITGTSS